MAAEKLTLKLIVDGRNSILKIKSTTTMTKFRQTLAQLHRPVVMIELRKFQQGRVHYFKLTRDEYEDIEQVREVFNNRDVLIVTTMDPIVIE